MPADSIVTGQQKGRLMTIRANGNLPPGGGLSRAPTVGIQECDWKCPAETILNRLNR